MSNKTLIIGANGALGSDLMKVLAHPIPAVHKDFDICDAQKTAEFIQKSGADTVINTAAFHRVPDCETRYQEAFEVNVIGVRNLARICGEQNIHLCHISTDYVFDGTLRRPYREDDKPCPLSVYGISKLAGEHALAAYCDNWSVVRSCGLYGKVPTRAKGGNFINTMVNLGRTRDKVTVVDDEMVCPTYTSDLAKGIAALLFARGKGIYHITQSGQTTWYDFTRVIFDFFGFETELAPIKAADFQSVVRRPVYSILDNSRFQQKTDFTMPDWKDALVRHLKEI